jgi:hypothetical protein
MAITLLNGRELPAGAMSITTHDLLRDRIRHNWADPSLSIVVIYNQMVEDGTNETGGQNWSSGFYFVPFQDHNAANHFCNTWEPTSNYVTVWVDGEVVHENS